MDYNVHPSSYFQRAEENLTQLKEDARPAWFFYAAFEYRCCIEQLLRYYLELVGVHWSKKMEKLYTAADLRKTILSLEPEFYSKLRFADVLIRALDHKGVYEIDLERLSALHGRMGGYLHAQIKPDQTVNNPAWWDTFWNVLQDTREHLFAVLSNDIAHIQIEKKGWPLYNRWKDGTMTEEEVQGEFMKGLLPNDSA